jgi:hypothetical protein
VFYSEAMEDEDNTSESTVETARGVLSLPELETYYATERNLVPLVRGGRAVRGLGPAFIVGALWIHSRGQSVPPVLFVGLATSIIGSFSPFLPGYLAKREFDRGLLPRTYSIGSEGVSVEQSGRAYVLDWTSIKHFDEGPDWAWVYPATGAGIFLPKRLFAAQALAVLRQHLQQHAVPTASRPYRRKLLNLLFWVVLVGVELAYFAYKSK